MKRKISDKFAKWLAEQKKNPGWKMKLMMMSWLYKERGDANAHQTWRDEEWAKASTTARPPRQVGSSSMNGIYVDNMNI